ncbi:MAG: 9-O-acetylesterase, partial [Acidobacteria bacterium]|nr:9-O-acetylesterase [Acidobacteriota bacterium]
QEIARANWPKAVEAARQTGKPLPYRPGEPVGTVNSPRMPSSIYNGMIAPLTPYPIRGVIWYQGESNATEHEAFLYRRLFRLLIEDWRVVWNQPDLPFLFVQLANFKATPWWAVLRESQTDALALRDTGMAVAIDIGDSTDIHPKNKQEVGRRLALLARSLAYGENIVGNGPLYRQMSREGAQLRLWFDSVGGGLAARGGGPLTGFTIAGADGRFSPAEARIDGSSVVVLSAAVPVPVAVRYAWEDDPVCNLVNSEGLPGSPFRTDGGVTP